MTSGDPASLARARAIPTSVLSDSVRDNGHPHQVMSPSIRSLSRSVSRVAGWAYTVVGRLSDPGASGPDVAKARAIDGMSEDDIAIWAGGEVRDVCLFGDLLAAAMQVRGVNGVVVDGGVRDIDEIAESGLSVFLRYATPKASTGFWRVTDVGIPAEVRGTLGTPVLVEPGDLIVADANGIVAVPRRSVEEVLDTAEKRLEDEVGVRSRIENGESVEALIIELGRI